MRTALRTNEEVAQTWVKRTQPIGRTKNMFFENDSIYSWGKHYCIARFIKPGIIAFNSTGRTSRRRSQSTSQHTWLVERAITDQKVVMVNDPDAQPWRNKELVTVQIVEALEDAALPRIRQPRRDRSTARALSLARQFNEYVAAGGYVNVEPFPTDSAQDLREYFIIKEVIERLES